MQNKFSWREILKGAVCLPFFSALIYSVLSTIKTPQETIFAKILAFILTFPLNLGVIFLSVGIQSLILSAILANLRKDRLLQIIIGFIGIIIIPLTYKCTKMTQVSVFMGGAITLYILIYRPAFMEKIFSKIG
ncbi:MULTISPECIES: hypothetical protein [unclassified Campylobacter]|uniref:hypothetical protein n=1 Tax=unclassified Campylobacter TaxID=2593542 RepID=UPI0022E9E39A|nr:MULTISPECIES: hypothetical protein [unclassified Campylobacter]MDA3064812.1 hypothetical protein [Campylobacter sp. CN_NE4]MDA3068364.1 hypothetical protein [Campylobacter sp. CN_NE3]MDA3082323.1 hypothetical protein [Campylobacter sp. CN_EL2]MDA3083958.1 hypothetical protein [Campylobacter sp. CN_NE1]MDA3087162.1 hypothetical protein [Campylobacter sp. CN_NA2]